MAGATFGATLRQIHRLLDEGGASMLGDGPLLDRFVLDRDERAFEELVGRHGTMVLATCSAVLRDRADAEDAFQAAFLALARRAATVRGRDSLASWLHRVAYREAVRLGARAARRRVVERAAWEPRAAGDPRRDDLRAAVHAEVERLPESYRLPVVLCDLEGLTKGQAAARLGWTEGAVRGRLQRARALLRDRLDRRGLGASADLAVAAMGREAGAVVAPGLAASAVRSALGAWKGGAAAGYALARLAAVALGAVALAGVVAAGMGRSGAAVAPAPEVAAVAQVEAKAVVPPPKPEAGETVEVRGLVVDPEGKPVAGARLRIDSYIGLNEPDPAEPKGTTGPDGRFAFRSPREPLDHFAAGRRKRPARLVATAPGFGFGWAETGPRSDALAEPTIRLVRDDVAIEGRILDLEGRPVAGAKIRPIQAFAPPAGGDLTAWIDGFKTKEQSLWDGLEQMGLDLPPVATGPDGRFRLVGVGRERLAQFLVSGPGIETDFVFAMTRDTPTIPSKNRGMIAHDMLFYHGFRFDYAAAPSRPIVGAIRDLDTGKPLAGVRVTGMAFDERSMAFNPYIEARTDAQGRYRLEGVPRTDRYRLFLTPGDGLPYLPSTHVKKPGGPALEPATVDYRLKRGVLIRGRLTDKATGKALAGAVTSYSFLDNPHVRDFPGFEGGYAPRVFAKPDGRFAIAAMPGRGLLAARLATETRYRRGVGADKIPGMNPRESFSALPMSVTPFFEHVLASFDAPVGAEVVTLDLQADPGRTLTGSIVGPDGAPVPGCLVRGLADINLGSDKPQDSPDFEATGIDPSKPRRITAMHGTRGLAGSLLVLGDEPGPLVLKLQPWGTITGRVVDDEGRPWPKLGLFDTFLDANFDPNKGKFRGDFADIEGGRFRIRVVPGLAYRAFATKGDSEREGTVFDGLKVGPGDVKDLGDITIVPRRRD